VGRHSVLYGDLEDLVLSPGNRDAALFLAGEQTTVGDLAFVLGHDALLPFCGAADPKEIGGLAAAES